MSGRNLLIIGIDGATLDLIEPWALEGKLPTFAKLIEGGAGGPLLSTVPPLTSPAWISALTGVNPGRHNIYDFFTFVEGTYRRRPVNSSDIRAELLWEMVNRSGMRAGILNAPLAYPVQPLDGFLVSGMLTPERAKDHIYPPELKKELDASVPGYRFTEDFRLIVAGDLEGLLEDIVEVTEKTFQVARYLLRSKKPELFFVLFDGMDRVLHFYWKFMDARHPRYPGPSGSPFAEAVLSYHQLIDRILSEFLDQAGDETDVIVLSDHGFGPLHKDVYITNWLVERGWLVLEERSMLEDALKKGAARALSRLVQAKRRLEPFGLARLLASLVPQRLKDNAASVLDMPIRPVWERTKAFVPSSSGRAIRINLKGREPRGVVSPGKEYERLVEEIAGALSSLCDPETGESIVEKVYRKEEVFSGHCSDNAPDIVIELKGTYFLQEGLAKDLVLPSRLGNSDKSGVHRPEGILFLWGDGVKKGARLAGASILDVTPTALYRLGLPVPRGLDGRILFEAFEQGFVERFPPRYDDTGDVSRTRQLYQYTDEEADAIGRRLKGLNYI
jgi:predicted AlkP superfamily phosphohydrolase/phosphomutase